MKRLVASLAVSLFLIPSMVLAEDFQIEKYEINVPQKFHVPYSGKYADRFPDGFPIGIGSGMCYIGKGKDGARYFYANSDRGPNANAPKVIINEAQPQASKIFSAPSFSPSYGALRLKDGKVELVSLITIKNERSWPISGRPLPKNMVGATGELPLDDHLRIAKFDKDGQDTEGIDIDRKDGNLWICDEYGPFISKMDANTGRIVKKYGPGNGLPDIIKHRQPNRGLEGLCVTPSNKVVAAVQSICDVDGKIKKSKATFTRLVWLDPETGATKMFAYPHDVNTYKLSRDAKIGDLATIDENRFLLIERGKGKEGTRIMIYVVDIANATDITGINAPDDRPLETLDSINEVEAQGVKYVKKTLVLDLVSQGWEPGKAEGIALLPDHRTIAICSDNDFGMKSKVVNPAKDSKGKDVASAKAYTTDGSGKLKYKDKTVDAAIEVEPSGKNTAFWVIKLPRKIDNY